MPARSRAWSSTSSTRITPARRASAGGRPGRPGPPAGPVASLRIMITRPEPPSSRVVPAPGAELTSIRPPTSPARSSSSRRPRWGRSSGGDAAGSKPAPSSVTARVSRSPSAPARRPSRSSTAVASACATTLRSASCATRNANCSAGPPEPRAAPSSTTSVTATPRAVVVAARSPSAAARPVRRRLGGWMSTTSERSERIAGAHGVRGEVQPARLVAAARPIASTAAPASAIEVAARSWTTPSCRSAAIRRRSASDAASERCSISSRSRRARAVCRASRTASGNCTSCSSTSAPIVIGRNCSQIAEVRSASELSGM